jgi:SAM-dependent methyltransferase
MPRDKRTLEQFTQHYLVEKELADRLKSATREERRELYADVYDELFERVPTHPQNTHVASPAQRRAEMLKQFNSLQGLIASDTVYLEIGAGDCALAMHIARFAKQVYALDVAESLAREAARPSNFVLIISDGVSIPVPEPVDLVYSNQLMEHLHPDDAEEQLRNIYDAMRKGARYFCVTPNRLTGPHDISLVFEEVATGFHLKEYTCTELNRMFRKVGFRQLRYRRRIKGITIQFDSRLFAFAEQVIEHLPRFIRRPLVRFAPVRLAFNSIHLVGVK